MRNNLRSFAALLGLLPARNSTPGGRRAFQQKKYRAAFAETSD